MLSVPMRMPTKPPGTPPVSNKPEFITFDQLLERARSPRVTSNEIDVLLNALMRPPRPEQDRERQAQRLRVILADPTLRGLQGSDGRRVYGTAAQAMVALGQPYGSQLTDEDREALRGEALWPSSEQNRKGALPRADSSGAPWLSPVRRRTICVILLCSGLIELLIGPKHEYAMGFTALTGLLPPLLLLKQGWFWRWSYRVSIFISSLLVPPLWLAAFLSLFIGGSDAMLAKTSTFIVWVLFVTVHRSLLGACVALETRSTPT